MIFVRLGPPGVITFKRYVLSPTYIPDWSRSVEKMVPVHITSSKKIEDVHQTLQVKENDEFIINSLFSFRLILLINLS